MVTFTTLSLLPQAAIAQQKTTVEEATKIAKSIITIPEDIKDFKSNYFEYNDRGVWQLQWQTEEGDITVNVDALSQEITQMHKYKSLPNQSNRIYSIEKRKAIDIAHEFMAMALPSKHHDLKLLEARNVEINKYEQSYILNFHRTVNGIPFMQNSAHISVSALTGEVLNYNLNWDYNLEFASKSGLIGEQKASQLLKDNAFELMYHKVIKDKKTEIFLVYGMQESTNPLVNAHTGEYSESPFYYARLSDKNMAMGAGEMAVKEEVQLNPIELEEVDTIKGLLDKNAAIDLAKKYLEIPTNYILKQANLYQDYYDKNKRTWSLEWQLNDENEFGYISVKIDAKNKEILSFYQSEDFPERHLAKANYTHEEALKIAEEFIAKIQAQKFKQVRLNEKKYQDFIKAFRNRLPEEADDKMISLEYTRYINEIPLYADSIRVNVDLLTGKVTSFYCDWTNVDFPQPNKLVNKEGAFNKLTKENKINLEYTQTDNFYRLGKINEKINLFYQFSKNEPKLINAFTGKLLSYDGQEFVPPKADILTDIEGHPNQKDIKLLFDLGIIVGEKGKYFPDRTITNAEFIKMLVLASNYYPGEGRKIEELGDEWYAPYYQTAIYRKIIDKNNLPQPNSELTRIEASYMLLKALKIDYVAELNDIFLLATDDAGSILEKDKGFITIATKLTLIKIDSGNFNPGKSMLKGETASTLVQYMRLGKE